MQSILPLVCHFEYKVDVNGSIRLVANIWYMQKFPYVFRAIVGGRKVEHLLANLEALNISLLLEQTEFLDGVVPFERDSFSSTS